MNIDGQAFFEALEDSVIVLDGEGRYLFANQVALRALGRSFAEIEGRSFRDVVPSTRGAPFDEAFRHAVAGGRAQRALGTSAMTGRDYEFTITPLNGRFIAVLRDVTEAVANKRRAEQAEAALGSSQDRLQSVIDCAPFPIYAKDLDARYLLVNRSTAELFGRPADEILGHTDDELIDPATAAAFKRGELAALGKGEVRGEEKVRIGGKERTFLTTRFTLKDEFDGLQAVAGISVDVTAFRDAEERLREADRRKDEFLAMLGHELRNPLAPILSALRLLADRAPPGSGRELGILDRQTRHLVRLVDELLDVSRIRRGTIQLRREPSSLAEAVRRAVEMVEPAAAEGSVAIEVAVEPGLVLDADPVRLSQLVGNLVSNAVKYSERGQAVRLRARRDGDDAVLTVEDDGRGIAAELLPRLFEPFAQGDASLDRAHGGLGLGLSIVRGVASLHGGSVAVASGGPGQGSRFEVRLPALPAGTATVEPEAFAPRRAPVRKISVLLVDDNTDAAELLAEFLDSVGYETRVAFDGPSALSTLGAFVPDVALLDIGLPSMSGYELARRIRKLPTQKAVRLVALTGYGQDSDRERSREAGFDRHLVKPVEADALLLLLDELTNQAKA